VLEHVLAVDQLHKAAIEADDYERDELQARARSYDCTFITPSAPAGSRSCAGMVPTPAMGQAGSGLRFRRGSAVASRA